jgi:hypothetical protein
VIPSKARSPISRWMPAPRRSRRVRVEVARIEVEGREVARRSTLCQPSPWAR